MRKTTKKSCRIGRRLKHCKKGFRKGSCRCLKKARR